MKPTRQMKTLQQTNTLILTDGGNHTLDDLVNSYPIGQELSGSQIYRYTLEMLRVEEIGVYIGGRCIDLIDELGKSKKIQLKTGFSESDLEHALQAFVKVKRKPAFAVVTSGPGGTNSATPILDACFDGDPIIVTIGQVDVDAIEIEDGPFQGGRMVEPFSYWSKWTYRIKDVSEIQSVLKTAYNISTTGRPGPVVIELPSQVAQNQKTVLKPLEEVPVINIEHKKPKVYSAVQIKAATLDNLANALVNSKRPFGIFGGGVYNADAVQYVIPFTEKVDSPFAVTLMLVGAVGNHRLHFGMAGMHGDAVTNLAIHNSDILVYCGGRLDDRVRLNPKLFAPYAKIFWVEPNYPGINPEMAKRVHKIEVDAKEALEYLLRYMPQLNHERWIKQSDFWREKYPLHTNVYRSVIQQIRDFVTVYEAKEPFVATGVGAHQMAVATMWDFNPELAKRMLLTSGGLGTMGTAMPFAVGAAWADPSRSVYAFNGDGSAVMDQRAMPIAWQLAQDTSHPGIKEVIFRDEVLNMVDVWQTEFWDNRKTATAVRLPENYFMNLARASEFGYFAVDYRGSNNENNRGVIEEFVKYRGNAILEVKMYPQSARPMIPAGKSVADIKLPNGMVLDPQDLLIGQNW